MVDVNTDEDKTIDQSNSIDSEATTEGNAEDTQHLDDSTDGHADDENASDGGDQEDEAEGTKKTRGEVRHERYIDKLSAEIRASNDQSTRYTQEIFTPKPYQPLEYKEGEEYDPKALEQDRKNLGDNKFAEGINQGINQGTSQVAKELWADRFDTDTERVTNKWDVLNPEKPESFNANLEASLVQKYIAFAGVEKDQQGRVTIQKPNIRFRDFVDAEMKNLEDYAAIRNAASSKNLVRQAAQTGVRPNGQSRTTKGDHGFDPSDPAGSVSRMTKKQYFELGGREASDKYVAERFSGK
jgi:hypothetical protein